MHEVAEQVLNRKVERLEFRALFYRVNDLGLIFICEMGFGLVELRLSLCCLPV